MKVDNMSVEVRKLLEDCAFMDCSSLAEVTVQWTTADAIPSGDNMGSAVFRGIAADAKLRVPTGTTALYEAADQWKDFVIEEYTPTPTALPNVNVNANVNVNVNGKFIRNGQFVIVKDGKTYNAMGAEL